MHDRSHRDDRDRSGHDNADAPHRPGRTTLADQDDAAAKQSGGNGHNNGNNGNSAGQDKRVDIGVGKANRAELVKFLHIGKTEQNAKREVVMHLGPGDLPDLEKGDRLFTPAELQVTSQADIGQHGPGTKADPHVSAMLLLTGNPKATSPGKDAKKIAGHTQTVTKNEHHAMFVFGKGASIRVGDMKSVKQDDCHVTLVMWAWDSQARSGGRDVVLIGANEGDFLKDHKDPDRDRARLTALRERDTAPGDHDTDKTSGGGDKSINTNANPELIYSHCLNPNGQPLEVGEQYYVEARVVADANKRARFATQMFLTKNPKATDGHGMSGVTPGQIGERNGINITPGSPDAVHKVAVFRVDQPINGKVFVNVVADAAVPGGGSANVTVKRNAGYLKATRYDAGLGK